MTTKIEGQASPHRDTTHYQYDLMGNLLAVSLPNGDNIEYLIDAQNRRVGKILNGIAVKRWIYQDQLNPIAELDGNDSLLARFVYGSKAHVPDYVVKGVTTYRVITDHLGSIRAVVNVVTGKVAQEISYNEFGVILHNSNPGFQPFVYAGGLYDVQTGLVRFGARDYDCFSGRWTAKDPIGFGGGFNFFIYVNNDPLNRIDPYGLDEDSDDDACEEDNCEFGECYNNCLRFWFGDSYDFLMAAIITGGSRMALASQVAQGISLLQLGSAAAGAYIVNSIKFHPNIP